MNVHSGETATRINNDFPRYRHKMPAAIFMLADDGRILESNAEGKKLLEFNESGEKHIGKLLPFLTEVDLVEKGTECVNSYLRFLSHSGHHFKVTGPGDMNFAGKINFSDIFHHDQHLIMITIYQA